MKHTIVTYIFLFLFVFPSMFLSISKISAKDQTKAAIEKIIDKQWKGKLDKEKVQFMEAWLKMAPFKDSYWISLRPNLKVTNQELDLINCIPIESFETDSIHFGKMKLDTPLQSILKLKKDEADCFLLKDSDFLIIGSFVIVNKQWHNYDQGLIPKEMSAELKDLYFNKKVRLIKVFVNTGSQYRFRNLAYIDNDGVWMVNPDKYTRKQSLLKALSSYGK